jgi:transcriptional regulator with XRE-family HTH domain
MDEKKLRQTIGSRTRARRKELNLTQGYLAEKMDVNKSTIQRYEKGTIDNTKKLVVEGLASALHVTPEYLRGETDLYESTIQNKRTLEILDAMDKVKDTIPLGISTRDNEFAENLLLLLLKEYEAFAESFTIACHRYAEQDDLNDALAEAIGLDSGSEFNTMQFLTEIMHTVNMFYELSNVLRDYAHDPAGANDKVVNLMDYL